MSVTYVSAELRRTVADRAFRVCEYCLIAEEDTHLGCAVDHIISEKHGGPTVSENLAYCCVFCNQAKGSDIGSISWENNEYIRFFNPRMDRWSNHFKLDEFQIVPITEIGKVTARILKLDEFERIQERQVLWEDGRYPSEAGLRFI